MADSFFSQLKLARERNDISLAEISDATLISVKMLEALERGDTTNLPQAYIRAFIREYATAIGLDESEVMKKYDIWQRSTYEAVVAPPAAQIEPSPPKRKAQPGLIEPVKEAPVGSKKSETLVPTLFKGALALSVLILMNIALWNLIENEPTPPTKETPFRDVVKGERDRRGIIDSTSLVETTHPAAPSESFGARTVPSVVPQFVPPGDSMTLVATTTDSVWMEIVTDDEIITDHYLEPNTTFKWRAKNEFWISAIGNPTALRLALNGKPIAIPYRKGYVTRDLRINRDSLRTR